MKRVVICASDPWKYIPLYKGYSLMVVNPAETEERKQYLLDSADWSLLVTDHGEVERDGADYVGEYLVLYTSGTTGNSKFFGFTKQQVEHVAESIASDYELTPNDRYLSVMPLWHAHGMLMYQTAQYIGFEVKFVKMPDLKNKIDFQPTWLSAIPDIVKLLTKQSFEHLRFVRTASIALPDHLYNTFKEQFKVPVLEAFGMTETCSHCFTNPLYGKQRIGTVGLTSGVEAKIVDHRLYLRGPSVYKQDWIDTGDLAKQDDAGYYQILGRADDRINIRGFKIDPLTVETALYNKFANIGEVYIFGSNKVSCVYTGDVDPAIVRKELTAISVHCTPRQVERVDSVPRNGAGKVSRKVLTNLYTK
jgi:long-chain acyl-CoA synthetase